MERSLLKFSPKFEGEIEGWAKKFAQRNRWRIPRENELEDLMQDAYLEFVKCRDRYATVTDPPHFMRLFQTCFRNHITSLAHLKTKRREVDNSFDFIEDERFSFNEVEFESCLDEAPKIIQKLFQLFREDKPPYARFNTFRLGGTRATLEIAQRETSEEYFGRLLGLSKSMARILPSIVKRWLSGDDPQFKMKLGVLLNV